MISENDKKIISDLIHEAELKTSAELVPMIVERSDEYAASHFRCAILTSFILSILLYLSPLKILNPIYFIWIQIPGFIIGYLLANIDFIDRFFVTNREKEEEVYQRALEAFFDHNLHTTDKHNGVLLFISLFERKVKIIADIGIKEKINDEEWNTHIKEFISVAKSTHYSTAIKNIIPKMANTLSKSFPCDGSTNNEIKNAIIIE